MSALQRSTSSTDHQLVVVLLCVLLQGEEGGDLARNGDNCLVLFAV